jgi:hypothetical protein
MINMTQLWTAWRQRKFLRAVALRHRPPPPLLISPPGSRALIIPAVKLCFQEFLKKYGHQTLKS